MDINLKIVMDHNIPKACDFSARNLGMGVLEFDRYALSRLTEYCKLKQHSVLVPAAVEEVLFLKPTCVLPYLPRCLKLSSRSESSRCIHSFHVGENVLAPDIVAAFLHQSFLDQINRSSKQRLQLLSHIQQMFNPPI